MMIVQNYEAERNKFLEMLSKQLGCISVLRSMPDLWGFLENKHIGRISKYLIAQFKVVRQMEFDELNDILIVTRCLIENSSKDHAGPAERVLLRLKGLKRHKLKQVDQFLNTDLAIPDFLT